MTTESHQTTVTGTDASCSCGWSMPGWSNEQQAKEAAEGHRLYQAEASRTPVEPTDAAWDRRRVNHLTDRDKIGFRYGWLQARQELGVPLPPPPTSDPPREEAGGWKRDQLVDADHADDGEPYWIWAATGKHDYDVPIAVEAAIRAPLEAALREAREDREFYFKAMLDEMHEIDKVMDILSRARSNAYHSISEPLHRRHREDRARRALTPDEGGK